MASPHAYCQCEEQSLTPGLAICPRCGRLRGPRPSAASETRRMLAVFLLMAAVLILWQWLGFPMSH